MFFDTPTVVQYNGRTYVSHHGDAFDRGSADSYYGRIRNPHKGGVGGTSGPRVESNEMTLQEIADYGAGYNYNERFGGRKDYD
jgi:hypothetical protein